MKVNIIPALVGLSAMFFVNCGKETLPSTLNPSEGLPATEASDRAVCFISVKAECPVNVCGSQTNDDFCSGLKGTEIGVKQAFYALSVPAKVQFSNLPFGQNCVVKVTNSLSGQQTILNLASGQSKTIKVGDNCGIEALN